VYRNRQTLVIYKADKLAPIIIIRSRSIEACHTQLENTALPQV